MLNDGFSPLGYASPTMRWRNHEIGVCSWSLRPANMRELISKMQELDLTHVHLAMQPLMALSEVERKDEIQRFHDAGLIATAAQIGYAGEDYSSIPAITRTAGLVPSNVWPTRLAETRRAAELAGSMGIKWLSLHLGFVPQSNDPAYAPVLARVCEIAEPAGQHGVSLLLETGQETASELLQFLNDLRCQTVEANYDPANFILYGVGDPLDSIRVLDRHIRHVHLKDALLSDHPGNDWGKETRLGEGQVPFASVLDALENVGYDGPLVIENEFDENLDGIRVAMEMIASIE